MTETPSTGLGLGVDVDRARRLDGWCLATVLVAEEAPLAGRCVGPCGTPETSGPRRRWHRPGRIPARDVKRARVRPKARARSDVPPDAGRGS